MPTVTRRAPRTNGSPSDASRAAGQAERRRRRRWLRVCRVTAKKKWRQIGAAGLLLLLLAAVLLCVAAYLDIWHSGLTAWDRHDQPDEPSNDVPTFFEGKAVPQVFLDYAAMHNKMTEDPESGKFVIYELPGNVTLPHALLGLTSTFLFALMSQRALLVQWTTSWEAPGPDDLGGSHASNEYTAGDSSSSSGWGSNDTLGGATATRTSSLEELFVDPGFYWAWDRFAERWTGQLGLPEAALEWDSVDPTVHYEEMVCRSLPGFRASSRFLKVTSSAYYAPLLTVNKGSSGVLGHIPALELFAYLSNWLLRPVPAVMAAVRSFTQRYFDRNFVIGMEMSLFDSRSELGTMSLKQQQLFFQEASAASYQAERRQQASSPGSAGDGGSGGGSASSSAGAAAEQGGVVLLVVTDDELALRSRMKNMGQDSLGAAGVIAITGPNGAGTARILTELQEAWLLGYSDVCIVSPGSAMGVFGHARTSKAPLVIIDGQTVHQSTSSQPCLADIGLVQHTSCFAPAMLGALKYDPAVPCVNGEQGGPGSGQQQRQQRQRRERGRERRWLQDSRALMALAGQSYAGGA